MSAERRKLADGAEDRIAAAGVRSWPVVIRVNHAATATGITTIQNRAEGAAAAFMLVGEPIECADSTVDTPDGLVVVPGIATAILAAFESVSLRKVA